MWLFIPECRSDLSLTLTSMAIFPVMSLEAGPTQYVHIMMSQSLQDADYSALSSASVGVSDALALLSSGLCVPNYTSHKSGEGIKPPKVYWV